MNIDNVSSRLREEIALVAGIVGDEVNIELSLTDNGVNSLGFVELMLAIEQQFGVKLMDSGLNREDLASVTALAEKIIQLAE
ncbi:MAG: phosphopantetheine-binding protein [Victivallaceae bacterium]|nr:phosphopantetheine-binding protein [Victivallaceae bacterium]